MPTPGVEWDYMNRDSGFRAYMPNINLERLRITSASAFGHPLTEFVAGALAGHFAKEAIKVGLVAAGFNGLFIGMFAGGTFAFGKEYLRQATENWRGGLSPDADNTKAKILERLGQLQPNDYIRLGSATLRGAFWGAVGGTIAGVVSQYFSPSETIASGDTPGSETVNQPEAQPTTPDASPSGPSTPDSTGSQPDGSTPTPSTPDSATPGTPDTPTAPGTPATPPGPGVIAPEVAAPDGYAPDTTAINSEIAKMPAEISLQPGDNPWSVSENYLKQVLGRDPTPGEIMRVTQQLAIENHISVPEWGITGQDFVSARELPVNHKLIFNDNVKNVILKIATK